MMNLTMSHQRNARKGPARNLKIALRPILRKGLPILVLLKNLALSQLRVVPILLLMMDLTLGHQGEVPIPIQAKGLTLGRRMPQPSRIGKALRLSHQSPSPIPILIEDLVLVRQKPCLTPMLVQELTMDHHTPIPVCSLTSGLDINLQQAISGSDPNQRPPHGLQRPLGIPCQEMSPLPALRRPNPILGPEEMRLPALQQPHSMPILPKILDFMPAVLSANGPITDEEIDKGLALLHGHVDQRREIIARTQFEEDRPFWEHQGRILGIMIGNKARGIALMAANVARNGG